MRKFVLILLLLALPLSAQTVTLLHISDYHSHALPFYTDDGELGGIARAIGYLRQQKRSGALVFSGGDTVNKGAPAWSDKYGCAEWAWFDGILDAAAFGNHDADYGLAEFEKCRKSVQYPILSANTKGFQPYVVIPVKGVRIGVFALAGADFPKLVKVPELTFSDPMAAARETVRTLREKEKADAVVMIGHQDAEDDYAMAKAVPGIDLIFGSHSHMKRDLTRIPGTNTTYISPSQYLTYISRVQMKFADGRVTAVIGGLIPVDERLPEDRGAAERVQTMQKELEEDPKVSRPVSGHRTPGRAAVSRPTGQPHARHDARRQQGRRGPLHLQQLPPAPSQRPHHDGTAERRDAVRQRDRGLPDDRLPTCSDCSTTTSHRSTRTPRPTSCVRRRSSPIKATRWPRPTTWPTSRTRSYFACDRTMSGLRVRDEVRKTLVKQ